MELDLNKLGQLLDAVLAQAGTTVAAIEATEQSSWPEHLRRAHVRFEESGEIHPVIIQRHARVGGEDDEDTAYGAIASFIKQAKGWARNLDSKRKRAIRETRNTFMTAPVVDIDPEVAIAVFEAVELWQTESFGIDPRQIWDAGIEPIDIEPYTEYVNKSVEALADLPWVPLTWSNQVLFVYGCGVWQHQLEATILLKYRNKIEGSPHRAFLAHTVSNQYVDELAFDGALEVIEPWTLGNQRQWLALPTVVPWALRFFAVLCHQYVVELPKDHLAYQMLRGKPGSRGAKRKMYRLDIDAETARTLVRQFLTEGKIPMRKDTVFDRIPCLDTKMGDEHPEVIISCGRCPRKDTQQLKRLGQSPTLFMEKWKKGGWKIKGDGKKATCPDCQKKEKKKGAAEQTAAVKKAKKETRRTFTDAFKLEVVTVCESMTFDERQKHLSSLDLDDRHYKAWKTKIEQDQKAKPDKGTTAMQTVSLSQQRTLFTLLDTVYDKANKTYRGEYTDEQVAEETSLAVAYVAEVRAEVYGPLCNPAVERLKTDMEELKTSFAEDHGALLEMAQNMRKKYEEKVTDLERQIEEAQ